MSHHMKVECQQYLHQPVQLHMNNQQAYSGVIEHVDDENVYVMVPIDENGQYLELNQLLMELGGQGQAQQAEHVPNMSRQATNERYGYFPGYYPFQPYPYYPYYPYTPYYSYPRPIGWGRLILPLAALTAIAALQ